MYHYLIFAFSSLWISSGIIGYWELVIYLKDQSTLKNIPKWAWAISECLFPMLAMQLYSVDFGPQTVSLFITFVVTAALMNRESKKLYTFVTWLTTVVGFFGMMHLPILFAHRRFALLFLFAGIAMPLLQRWKNRLFWVVIYPVVFLFVIFYVDGRSDFMLSLRNVFQWTCTSLPLFAYLFVQQHRGILLKQRYHDPLTNALNRRGYDTWMESNKGSAASFLVLDIDDFKYMNDTFGHDVGDAVLIHVVQRMKARLRSTDEIVRFGGDEFVCLLPGLSDEQARDVAHRVHDSIVAEPITIRNITVSIRASMGVAHGAVDENLLIKADQRLLQAKRIGKNCVCFTQADEFATYRQDLESSRLRWIADAMRGLIEFSPQGFILTDENHNIVEVNPAFEVMTGYARSELIGHRPNMLASQKHQNSAVYQDLKREISQSGFWRGTFINQRPTGEPWHAHETITAIQIGGKVVGYWALVLCDSDAQLDCAYMEAKCGDLVSIGI